LFNAGKCHYNIINIPIDLLIVPFFISNGVGRSGTFCAIASSLERVKQEQVLDVFQTVKSIRVSRPGTVETLVCIIEFTTYKKNRKARGKQLFFID
jgi:hypothetical protein